MIKTLNVSFEEEEYAHLNAERIKLGKTWKDFILSLVPAVPQPQREAKSPNSNGDTSNSELSRNLAV
jgi:hypothetical protein